MLRTIPSRLFALALALVANTSLSFAADSISVDWLRGSGNDLELCIQGEVLDAEGKPATDFELNARIAAEIAMPPVKPAIDGHRFKIWLKVNQPHSYTVVLQATSAKNGHIAHKTLEPYELRQAAIEGIKLKLQPPARQIKVKVTDRGEPVRGASVTANLRSNIELQATTGDDGIATISLPLDQDLFRLTATTDDHRVGGSRFYGSASNDSNADVQVIKLSKSRDLKLRFVNEDGSPAPGVHFKVALNTPKPHHANHETKMAITPMTSNSAGEAVFPWLPTWADTPYYVEIPEKYWILDHNAKVVDDFVVYKIKNRPQRKQITGRVTANDAATTPGGFFATLRSPQGEHEFSYDEIRIFTNPDGSFTADVLSDARYGCYVLDARWAGSFTDLVPYDSISKRTNSPELIVAEGQLAKVVATEGRERKPLSNAEVKFRRNYEFAWRKGEKQQWEVIQPHWSTTTDASGVAVTNVLPGEITASIHVPNWGHTECITVTPNEPATIKFHREFEKMRTVTGRVILDPGATANLKDAEIQLASMISPRQQVIKCNADGSFKFETPGAGILAIARTTDGRAYGTIFTTKLDAPIEIKLAPTQNFEAQLLGKDDQPAAGDWISATVKIDVEHHSGSKHPLTFEFEQFKATTTQQGMFTLRGLPTQREIAIYCTSIDRKRRVCLDQLQLKPTESLPRKVFRLESYPEPPAETPLADRVQAALRDGSQNGKRLLLILAHDSKAVKEFVDENYLNSTKNKEVDAYIPIVVPINWSQIKPDDILFFKDRDWPLPTPGSVDAVVLGVDGKSLARHSISIMRPGEAERVAEFFRQHAAAAKPKESVKD